jgi:hypothetical protein
MLGKEQLMNILTTAAGILTAAALTSAGAASAAPTGPMNAADTVQALEGHGFKVILNRVGDAPLMDCAVSSVRPGRDITQRVTDHGGDSVDAVIYRTVYVDAAC